MLNYAAMLEEKHFFEEAFTVYERGIAMFKWPFVYELWNAYLVKFIKRYVRAGCFSSLVTRLFTRVYRYL